MRKALVLALAGLALSAFGQAPAVMLEVKPVNRKDKLVYSRSLAVTVRSCTGTPIAAAVIRWAVIKEAYTLDMPDQSKKNKGKPLNFSTRSAGPPQAYGGEKTVNLAPLQTFVFETEEVKSYEGRFHQDPPLPGDSLVGHGVQVIVAGKVIAESFSDPRQKDLLEKIQTPEAGLPEGLKKSKSKKK